MLRLVIKMQEHGGYKQFRVEKARNKVALLFLYVKMLVERFGESF